MYENKQKKQANFCYAWDRGHFSFAFFFSAVGSGVCLQDAMHALYA